MWSYQIIVAPSSTGALTYVVSVCDRYPFPSLQTLGEDLVTVLDFLRVRYAVGLGEGAGANVLARCGLAHPARLLGLVLVNCTASTSSVADAFRSRFSRWRGADISHSEEDFLIYHKFGHVSSLQEPLHYRYQVCSLLFANLFFHGGAHAVASTTPLPIPTSARNQHVIS